MRGCGRAAAAAAALALGCNPAAGCGAASVASDETQIREVLARTERAYLGDLYAPGAGSAEIHPLAFLDVVVAAEGRRASVAAMLDAAGSVSWKDQRAELRYRGREKFRMQPCRAAAWCADGDELQRLRGVLQALLRRHDAVVARSPDGLAPLVSARYSDRGEDRAALLARLAREWSVASAERVAIRGWQVRVERDAADVGEDVRLERDGQPPGAARAVYRLVWEDDRWRFVSGL